MLTFPAPTFFRLIHVDTCSHNSFIYFFIVLSLPRHFFPLLLEEQEQRERERERNTDVRNMDWLPPVCAQTGDLTYNPRMRPDWSNPPPFSYGTMLHQLSHTSQGHNSFIVIAVHGRVFLRISPFSCDALLLFKFQESSRVLGWYSIKISLMNELIIYNMHIAESEEICWTQKR